MDDNVSKSPKVRLPGLLATYAVGFFSLSLVPMTSLIVPLWALKIGASPSLIGIVVASRALLPFLLSIHGGAMMDRLGARRMLLIFSAVGATLSFLYPVSTSVWVLIFLQLIVGWTQGMGWMGAQIKIAKLTAGNATYAGQFSFITTCGTAAGPLLAGIAWDFWGPWGAFTFIGVWGLCLLMASYALPLAREGSIVPLAWHELIPKPSDYLRAFALMSIPAVALIVAATFLRIGVMSVQNSFYTVYLHNIGLSGTLMGILVGMQSLIGGPAALVTGTAVRFMKPHWVLLSATGVSIVAITITPLFTTFVPLLIAAAIFGFGIGIAFPLLLSMLAGGIHAGEQGISVGLRTTANRAASIIIPVLMGLVIEVTGIDYGFLVIGLMLLAILAAVAWAVHRSAAFGRS
jgi:MFS family permease